ncbi:conserved unknown protein [Ectocarpus siliculosus]|uniref:PPM-type phosphatase domain-containing protein n=1 Tax=Ectocarpus siliculosus TaxID=2880 RepID=D7FIB7_ECTSI|nr:conserved unknown protein [Ectocarpus siliculosus]|eukprot:CBJ28741.1 conserved unknown protein [Ectocarpus siliculosus]
MGAGASIPGGVDPALSDAGKAALLTHLQAEYVAKASGEGADDKSILDSLKQSYTTKVKELEEAEKNGSDASDTEIAATAAAFSEKFGGGGAEPVAGGKTSEFRKRRLSVTSTQAVPKVAVAESRRQNSIAMYTSQEIGAAPDTVPLPFPDAKRPRNIMQVGTYSCHGVEPSYSTGGDDDDGVTAKINQDRGCVVYPFNEDPKHALFSVFDGHGEHGDVVSNFVMHELQACLAAHPSLLDDPAKALMESYVKVDESLAASKGEEATFSGTTAVSVLMRENNLWIANAGDSRAVLAHEDGAELKAVDLSVDQNPNSPKEQARIEAAGGFVSPPPEPGLSSRVWLDAAMTQIGLAMARSIGDHAVKSIGVVAEPEVTTHTIACMVSLHWLCTWVDRRQSQDRRKRCTLKAPRRFLEHLIENMGSSGSHKTKRTCVQAGDKFIVLASDGVWEFVKSQEAIDIVNTSLEEGTMKATQDLIEAAATKWREVEGDYRDDITAVVIRLPCFPE